VALNGELYVIGAWTPQRYRATVQVTTPSPTMKTRGVAVAQSSASGVVSMLIFNVEVRQRPTNAYVAISRRFVGGGLRAHPGTALRDK